MGSRSDDPWVPAPASAPELHGGERRGRRGFGAGLLVGCLLALAIPTVLLVLGVLALGVMTEVGALPDTAAVPRSEMRASTLEFLRAEELVEPDEVVLFFYSDGFLGLSEDGNYFTNRRVVSYWEEEDELRVESAGYHAISDLSLKSDDSLFGNSTIRVTRLDGSWFQLLVSNEDDRDDEFFELLELTWSERRNGEPARAGEELPDEVLDFLLAEGLTESGEQVLFFYAKTSGSLRVDGNLCTDRRVISYVETDGELQVSEASHASITSIDAAWGEGAHATTLITIASGEDESFQLWVSPAGGGDRAFLEVLEQAWSAGR